MSTEYLGIYNGGVTGGAVPAVNYNDQAEAVDRLGQSVWYARKGGAQSGWQLPSTAGDSQVTTGIGYIGPVLCRTTAAQVISGLAVGGNYIHAITDTSSARTGTPVFSARNTSAAVTNADGTTTGTLLGWLDYNATTGVRGATAVSGLRKVDFPMDWFRQTIGVSIGAIAEKSTVSGAVTFSQNLKFGWPSAIPAQASCIIEAFNYHSAGFTVRVFNNNSNAATTYSQAYEWYGIKGG